MRIGLVQAAIAVTCVRRQQANFVRHGFVHKIDGGLLGDLFEHARNDVALSLHSTNNWRRSRTSTTAAAALLIPMTIVVFAANPRFINLDNAAEFLFGLYDCCADFVADAVRRLVGAEAHLPLNLKRANSLFAGRHQMHDLEPVAQRLVGVFENRVDQDREPIAVRRALFALPMPLAGVQVVDSGIAAARTNDAFRPTAGLQIGFARILAG